MRVLLLAALASCQLVFPFDAETPTDGTPAIDASDGDPDTAPDPVAPVFQTANGGTGTQLLIQPQPTVLGNTLIVIIALSTETERVLAIGDNAGNTWVQAVDGENAESGRLGRLEIWYAANANPTTRVSVTMVEAHQMAANFTEWDQLDPMVPPLAVNTGGPGVNNSPRTGRITVGQPAVVIAAGVVDEPGVTANLESTAFTPMLPFATPEAADAVKGIAAYEAVEEFEGDVRWNLNAQPAWTTAIVAFKLRR